MFLRGKSRAWSMADGEQRARGFFLVLMSPDDDARLSGVEFRGLVRSVEMRQSGHFMTGQLEVKVGPDVHRIRLSGAYGADGLVRDVPRAVYELGKPLPVELREAWNKGGGHNSAGSEAGAMDAWARTLVYPASTLYGRMKR